MNEIFENAKRDPTLFSRIDINELLKNAKTDLEKTQTEITAEIEDALKQYALSETLIAKLKEYRIVSKVFEIQRGKHIRWLRPPGSTLTAGGIVVEIKFLDEGTHILCKCRNRFIQIKMDDCIIFQKLSHDEQLILMAYEFLHNI